MNNYIIYSIEIAVCLTLFYSVYWAFLRNETFFRLNRFYLVFSAAASLLIPLMNITLTAKAGDDSFITKYLIMPIEQYEQGISGNIDGRHFPKRKEKITPEKEEYTEGGVSVSADEVNDVKSEPSQAAPQIPEKNNNQAKKINWLTIALAIYFTGVALLLFRFLANFVWIFGFVLKHEPYQISGMKVIRSEKNLSPFSFLNFIFISQKEYPEAELTKIISHEKVHIQQKHSLDLILFELLLAFQWFNPFVWLYKRAIKITHEYLADQGTLNSGIDISSYKYSLLNQVLSEKNFEIANSYNLSVKKRISMMMKKRSSKLSALKLFIALPILFLLFSAFAFCTNSSEKEANTGGKIEKSGPTELKDTIIKRVDVPLDYLKLLEGEYVSTNEPGRVRRIIFTELLGTLHGWDNMIEFIDGYSYRVIPVGDGKFINPGDHESLIFDTKDKNAISLLLFGKIILKKIQLPKGEFAERSKALRLSIAYPLANIMLKDGIPAALSYYNTRKDSIYLAEHEMNSAGYDLLQAGKINEAAAIFKLNTEIYPASFNAYDSYAEALLASGDKNSAIENFKESLKLNPGNKNGLARLKELGVNTDNVVKKYAASPEDLKLLEGDYFSTNEPYRSRKIKFTEEKGTLVGNDNGYRYELLPMGKWKFINPDDGVSLVFDAKNKNAITLLLFGKINLKKFTVKIPKEKAVSMKKDSVKLTDVALSKYCGEYIDERQIQLSLFLKGDRIYRHMYNGVADSRLIPVSANMFIYDDDTGRVMEFKRDKNDDVISLTISSEEGDFPYNRKK